jgi:4'-phosphopantetheinyl transferase
MFLLVIPYIFLFIFQNPIDISETYSILNIVFTTRKTLSKPKQGVNTKMVKTYLLHTAALNCDEIFQQNLHRLSRQRQEKTMRYHFKKDRLLSLGAGLILDYGLRQYGITERDAEISQNANGKPYLVKHADIHFNLSHSGEYVIAAFAGQEIGADIQQISHNLRNIAPHFFCPSESAYISSYPQPEQQEAFCRIWCLKESFIKAVGIGLNLPLNAFEIHIGTFISVSHSVNEKTYHFREYGVNGYKTAVCCEDDTFDALQDITPLYSSVD